ncbi:hypothetical protein EUTSA_v10007696mg [Eutrema salsugineum]|uniref:BHLH domain-containing protein n=1 Tax=Eutrema salsugineum TaxID=72664 RepID=V4MR96_EUTSA|nr:transcription factor bHLH76 [Eutrema salsugineum]ESQ34261.1 hypothetical protein EUTSA_v10007696mg [Eutrema salsugineum]
MNLSEDKNEFAGDNSNRDNDGVKNFDSVNTPVDWRISASNPPVSYHLENPMPSICQSSSSPSQMMDSFRQNLWYDGGFNVHSTDAGNDDSTSFRGNIDRPLEMGWSMAQFPADSGFTERAAKFSLFGCGSFSELMMNQQGAPESNGLFLQDTEVASGSKRDNDGPASKLVKDRSNGPGNVSEDSQSSGGNGHVKCGETSSSSKKRNRIGKDFDPDQSRRAQQSGEEQEDKKNKKDEQSPNSNADKTNSGKQVSDPLKDGYIHMRARRGQATNSHSLAERVRREKSKRMKFLQDLVPGCDKVTGKAVMLDEIINYVQSLQCQIEFLSMKLSTVNPPLDFGLESLLAKDALQLSAPALPQSMSMLYPPLSYPSQTGIMQPNFSSMSPMNGGLKRQETHGYKSDHHNIVHMNHGTGTAPDHEDATANTKVEP